MSVKNMEREDRRGERGREGERECRILGAFRPEFFSLISFSCKKNMLVI